MLVAKAVNKEIRVLRDNDSVAEAIGLMDMLEVNTLPVIDHSAKKLLGQVSLQSLYECNGENSIDEVEFDEPVKIFKKQHLFHAIRLMLQYEMRLLPVIDEDWKLKGIIKRQQVLESLGQMLNLTEYGSVITIELNSHDFTLSEIVQLIENEGGKILGITVETPDAEKKAYEISIKLNLQDVSRVAAALRRYGYTILTEAESESYNIDLETRADELLNYLDM